MQALGRLDIFDAERARRRPVWARPRLCFGADTIKAESPGIERASGAKNQTMYT